jgi:methyl-accepting chemotaxis protein
MPTIQQIAEGAESLAATTASVADATQQLAVAATAADDVVRSSRNLMKWFIISLIVLAVAGAVMTAMRKKQSSGEA